jgi:GTP pyrophosphokinase
MKRGKYVIKDAQNQFIPSEENAKSKCKFDEVYDKFALRIVYKANPHDENFWENIFYCN